MCEPETKLRKQLRRHEGYRQKVYPDQKGILTVGYGRNLEAEGISPSEAEFMLTNDIRKAENAVDYLLDFYKIPKWMLSPVRRDVLVNMAFCHGQRGLGGYKLMFKAIAAQDFVEASAQLMDSAFGRTDKKRATELAAQLKTGEYRK
jgi:lysozyme